MLRSASGWAAITRWKPSFERNSRWHSRSATTSAERGASLTSAISPVTAP